MGNKLKTILVVEDEPKLLKAISDKLTREGFNTLVAKNGEEGVKIALSEKPDLILLDIIMPVMDGITALNQIRNDAWGEKVPIMMLTNLSGGVEVAKCLQSGVHDYLVKSDWTLKDVIKEINKRLE